EWFKMGPAPENLCRTRVRSSPECDAPRIVRRCCSLCCYRSFDTVQLTIVRPLPKCCPSPRPTWCSIRSMWYQTCSTLPIALGLRLWSECEAACGRLQSPEHGPALSGSPSPKMFECVTKER